jgi:hypothetical protein
MAWRIIKQPNGLYARFSDIVDNFTHYNMSINETKKVCMEKKCDFEEAVNKIQRANENPHRFEEAMDIIKIIHGVKEEAEIRKILTTKITSTT